MLAICVHMKCAQSRYSQFLLVPLLLCPPPLSNLFSGEKLLEVAAQTHLRYGEDLTVCSFEGSPPVRHNFEAETRQASAADLSKHLDNGHTIQFFSPQRHVDTCWELCAAMEGALQCLTGASCYLTPPHAQGLAPHHDDVDVWVLQC